MAYSTNPHLPKARAFALQLLIVKRLPLADCRRIAVVFTAVRSTAGSENGIS
jgi:hypothetical protein